MRARLQPSRFAGNRGKWCGLQAGSLVPRRKLIVMLARAAKPEAPGPRPTDKTTGTACLNARPRLGLRRPPSLDAPETPARTLEAGVAHLWLEDPSAQTLEVFEATKRAGV